MGNYVEPGELAAWGDKQRAAGLRIGFTCGAFDLLHAGHVDYLEEARRLCDTLIVAVNSDASIQKYKSPLRPVISQEQRLRIVGALHSVDAVTLLDYARPLPLIEQIKPHLYIKGGDYAASNLRSAKALEAWGGQAVVIKVRFDSSTTQTIERAALLALHAEPEEPPNSDVRGPARGIVLIDRDGTIVKSVPFLHEPARVELVPGVADAMAHLQSLGLRLAIVTNQQGIGLGYFTTDDFIAVNQAMLKQLTTRGVRISKIYFCPHSLAENCPCRKPGTRMLERALRDFGFTPNRAFVVGDSGADSAAAQALGIPCLRIQEQDELSWDATASAIEAAVAQW